MEGQVEKLKFEFTEFEVQLIAQCLGKMPFENVARLIAEIQKQYEAQKVK